MSHYDETEKTVHDSQIVRTKDNLKLSCDGPSQGQASGSNQLVRSQPLTLLVTLCLLPHW